MTPTELETAARNKYNAIGDSFFGQSEIFDLLYDACNQIAREALAIKATYTTSTVVSQHEYTKPSNTISIKRVTYNGQKLKPITLREDDSITGLNQSTTAEGTPAYYYEWDGSIFLRPIPSEVGTLKIYSYNSHDVITSTSTISVPTEYHMNLVDYVVSEMCAKDQNFQMATWYANKWDRFKLDCIRFEKKKLRGDSFSAVQSEEAMIEGYLGIV
jgi:hypothetical protein